MKPEVEGVAQKFGLFKLNTGVTLTPNNAPSMTPNTNFTIKFNLNTTPTSILKDERKLIVNKDLMSNPSINKVHNFTIKSTSILPSVTDGKIPQVSFASGYQPHKTEAGQSKKDMAARAVAGGFEQKSLSKDVDEKPRSLFDYPQNQAKLLKNNEGQPAFVAGP